MWYHETMTDIRGRIPSGTLAKVKDGGYVDNPLNPTGTSCPVFGDNMNRVGYVPMGSHVIIMEDRIVKYVQILAPTLGLVWIDLKDLELI